MSAKQAPVLIIGGSGVVGAAAAKALRQLQPRLPIAIGGRDLTKARAVAAAIDGTVAVEVDLQRHDLGLPSAARYSAIVVFLKDETLNSMRCALRLGIPYISLSSATFEIGPEVALFVHNPTRAPVLLASHWLGGSATLPALHFAAAYKSIDTIRLSFVLDEQDMGGPAAHADYERITTSSPASLVLEQGRFKWIKGPDAGARVTSVDGRVTEGQAYSPFDAIGLAAATHARNIRADLSVTESASRRRGEPFSTEIAIEIQGVLHSGKAADARHEMVHPGGQAPLTALSVALAVERLLGLQGGEAVGAGLYLPEVLIQPSYYVQRMQEFGARIETKHAKVSA